MVERYLDIIVEIKGKGAVTEVRNVKNELNKAKTSAQRFGGSVKGAEDSIAKFRITTGGLRREIGAIRNELLVLAFAFGGVAKAISESLDAYKKMQGSITGLITVGSKLGLTQDEVTNAAMKLAEDGLMSVSEASAGLKNLLSTKNYTLQQSINLMYAAKDAAAFNRQGELELGQAVVGATEGLKNMLSMKVDNAGITRNLSNMEEEYAATIEKTIGTLTEAERRMAHYVGFMKDAALFAGDAAKVTETYSGKLSQLNAITFQMKASLGELFSKGLMPIISALKNQFKAIKDNVDANKELLSVRVSNYFQELYTYASAATKAVAGFIETLWELRDLIKGGLYILVLNKSLLILYGIIDKLIGVVKAKIATLAAVRAAQIAANQTFVGATVITEANSVAVAKNIALQKGLATSLITTKVALLGIAAAVVGAYMAYKRLTTAQERARRSQIESIAADMDKARGEIELQKTKRELIRSTKEEIEEQIKSGKAADGLKEKLADVKSEIEALNASIVKLELENLERRFNKAKVAIADHSRETSEFKSIISEMGDPISKTNDQLLVYIDRLSAVVEKYKDSRKYTYTPTTETVQDPLGEGYKTITTYAKQALKAEDEVVEQYTEMRKTIQDIIKARTSLTALSKDDGAGGTDEAGLKKRNQLFNKIREATDKMKSEILKSYGEEQAAAHVAMLNEVEDRKLLAAQAKALGIDTAKFLKTTYEWQAAQYNEIFKKQIEEEQKLRLEGLKQQKKAADEAREIKHREAQAIIEATERVALLNIGYKEKEKIQVIDDANEIAEKLELIYIRSGEQEVEKRKQIIAIINDLERYKIEEIRKINNQWIIDSVNVLMQGAQEAASQVGYIWFQNERDTQNEIRRIRQEYSTKRVTDETEMLKKIEIAEKNSAIRTANAWKAVFGTMTGTIINSIQSAFMVQAQQATTFIKSLQWSLLGGVVGILGSLFTAWSQSQMKEEQQFMGMATSLEEQRRTSFGKISQAPVVNLSVVSNVAISGETVFISGGDVSELETGLENLITSTIQKRIDTGEIDINSIATG